MSKKAATTKDKGQTVGKIIAIIEDDQAISQMYRVKFESGGFIVQMAENGTLGFEMVKELRPHLVLLDLKMPDINGDVVLKLIRQEDWGEKIKVIILTNLNETEAPHSLKELGITDFIVKANLTPADVFNKVLSVLESEE